MSLGLRLDLKQSQQLVMTPQLQQAIKLLQMSNLELSAFVEGEVERNPLLILEDGQREAAARPGADTMVPVDHRVAEGRPESAAEAFDFSPGDPGAENLYDGSANDSPPRNSIRTAPGAGSSPDAYDFDQAPDGPPGLRVHLLSQLGQVRAPPGVMLLARVMVEELDEHGYLRADPDEIAGRLDGTPEDGAAALALLQGCEPTGVGARDLTECLALQLAERDRLDPAMRCLIENLSLIERGQVKRLQALCGVDAEDFADMLAELRRLDPRPCADFSTESPQTLVPDLLLARGRDGGWQIELNPETLPRVLVDRRYVAEVATATNGSDETREFLRDCRSSAAWLIRSLDQRARSILAVATQIVRHQEAFFAIGVAGLKPLTLAMVAEAAGLHESTASRVTANKHIATERGTFELKYFFTNAVGAEGQTAQEIRHRIRRLVDAETPTTVLSDDDIVAQLQSDGVDVARRTVAKYRGLLGIPSSVDRRRRNAILRDT